MAQLKTNEKLMKVLTTHTKMYHTRAMFGSQITENGYTVLKNGISQSMNCKIVNYCLLTQTWPLRCQGKTNENINC